MTLAAASVRYRVRVPSWYVRYDVLQVIFFDISPRLLHDIAGINSKDATSASTGSEQGEDSGAWKCGYDQVGFSTVDS